MLQTSFSGFQSGLFLNETKRGHGTTEEILGNVPGNGLMAAQDAGGFGRAVASDNAFPYLVVPTDLAKVHNAAASHNPDRPDGGL